MGISGFGPTKSLQQRYFEGMQEPRRMHCRPSQPQVSPRRTRSCSKDRVSDMFCSSASPSRGGIKRGEGGDGHCGTTLRGNDGRVPGQVSGRK
jgi:hypothetical protein